MHLLADTSVLICRFLGFCSVPFRRFVQASWTPMLSRGSSSSRDSSPSARRSPGGPFWHFVQSLANNGRQAEEKMFYSITFYITASLCQPYLVFYFLIGEPMSLNAFCRRKGWFWVDIKQDAFTRENGWFPLNYYCIFHMIYLFR